MSERRIKIERSTSIEAERLMRQRERADVEAAAFLRGLAMGLGIQPGEMVAQIDTDRDELVVIDAPTFGDPVAEPGSDRLDGVEPTASEPIGSVNGEE